MGDAAGRPAGGSRSPRGRRGGLGSVPQGEGPELGEEGEEPPLEDWDGKGPNPLERRFMGQLSHQRAYLEQVLKLKAPSDRLPFVKEAAAGLPIEAARALLLLGPQPEVPWRGLPADFACLAASLRLFARLLEGRGLAEEQCEQLCAAAGCRDGSRQPELPAAVAALARGGASSSTARAEALEGAAAACGLSAQRVASGVDSLKAMILGRPVACCVLLEAYVAVLEDPASGEELETEVGPHCLMVVGGDILGPTYIAFDPYGPLGGEVAYWASRDLDRAAPSVWVELSLPLD